MLLPLLLPLLLLLLLLPLLLLLQAVSGGVLICFADFLVLRVLMNRMRLVANGACPAVAWLCFVHDDDRNRCVVDGWGLGMGG